MKALLLLVVLSWSCTQSPQLHSEAETRVAQIAGSCTPALPMGCLSHAGFVTITPVVDGDWYAEVLAASNAPLTEDQAIHAWLASSEHRAILLHPGLTYYGYAQSEQPVSGWWYAAMLVEAPQ